jgi:hypothetical protein
MTAERRYTGHAPKVTYNDSVIAKAYNGLMLSLGGRMDITDSDNQSPADLAHVSGSGQELKYIQPLLVASVAETTAVGYIAEATVVSVTAASVRPAAKPTSVDSGEPTQAVSADNNTSDGSHAPQSVSVKHFKPSKGKPNSKRAKKLV